MQATKKHITILIIFFTLITLYSSCKKDHEKVYAVPTSIQPYIDEFINQAADRGVDLVIDDLIVELGSNLVLDGDEKAGLCTYGTSSSSPLIELDTSSLNWLLNDYTREQLVFHELGHCILGQRGHRNNRLGNGNYQSYMRADGTPIYGRLSAFKKDFYLDELFLDGNNITQPDWSLNQPEYSSISESDKIKFLDEDFNDNSENWVIEESGDFTSVIENGFYVFNNQSGGVQIQLFDVNQLNDAIDFEIEVGFAIENNALNYGLMMWGIKFTPDGFIDNSYYFGYSNDTYTDVGDFKTQSFFSEERNEINPYEINKMTIRKIGDFYHVYINEFYFDIFEYEPLPTRNLAFYVSNESILKVDYIRISELNL